MKMLCCSSRREVCGDWPAQNHTIRITTVPLRPAPARTAERRSRRRSLSGSRSGRLHRRGRPACWSPAAADWSARQKVSLRIISMFLAGWENWTQLPDGELPASAQLFRPPRRACNANEGPKRSPVFPGSAFHNGPPADRRLFLRR